MYGSLPRDLVPAGTTESDVKAAHKHGIFEFRVPMVVETPANNPVGKG